MEVANGEEVEAANGAEAVNGVEVNGKEAIKAEKEAIQEAEEVAVMAGMVVGILKKQVASKNQSCS